MYKRQDTGDIGLQKEIKIEQQNYSELEKELANEGAELLINFIDRLDGSIQLLSKMTRRPVMRRKYKNKKL